MSLPLPPGGFTADNLLAMAEEAAATFKQDDRKRTWAIMQQYLLTTEAAYRLMAAILLRLPESGHQSRIVFIGWISMRHML